MSEWTDLEDLTEPLDRIDAHVDSKNVGYLTSHPATDGGIWLKGMNVQPDYRGQGIAKMMLERAIQRYGDQEMSLRARPYGDQPADLQKLIAFYQRYGFQVYDDKNRMRRPANA